MLSLRNQKECVVGTKRAMEQTAIQGCRTDKVPDPVGLRPHGGCGAWFWEQGDVFKDCKKGDEMT